MRSFAASDEHDRPHGRYGGGQHDRDRNQRPKNLGRLARHGCRRAVAERPAKRDDGTDHRGKYRDSDRGAQPDDDAHAVHRTNAPQRVMNVCAPSIAIRPIRMRRASGGIRMANFSASRSHLMCMKMATMKPAFTSMNRMISDHRSMPCS